MVDNPELVVWLWPVAGEAFSVRSTDFPSVDEALQALGAALQEGRTLRFRRDSESDEASGALILVNAANIVALRVWPAEEGGGGTGQYL